MALASIKPGGGGDFLSYNAWEAAIGADGVGGETGSLDEKANGSAGTLRINVSNANNQDLLLTVGSGFRFNQEGSWPSCSAVEGVAGRITDTTQDVIWLDTSNVILEYLEVAHTSGSGSLEGVEFRANGVSGIVRYCMVHDIHRIGILLNHGSGGTAGLVHHCFIYNTDDDGIRHGTNTTSNVQNCTFLACAGNGIQLSSNNAACILNADNVIVLDSTGSDFVKQASASWGTSGNNMSSDTTAPGTTTYKSVTSSNILDNVTGGSEDLHLKAANDGTYEGSTETGSIDIDGETRTDWDIGADEIVGAAPSGNPWYAYAQQ